MHSFPQDVLVLFFVDVFALVVRLDGQLHFLYCPLLGVQLLQILTGRDSGEQRSYYSYVNMLILIFISLHIVSNTIVIITDIIMW